MNKKLVTSIAVSLLLCSATPTYGVAEYGEEITVTAVLNGANDDANACSGESLFSISETNLAATLSGIVPASSSPSLAWRSAYVGLIWETGYFANSASMEVPKVVYEPYYDPFEGGDLTELRVTVIRPNPEWLQLDSASSFREKFVSLDTNQDGAITLDDQAPGGGSQAIRSYVTNPFSVTIDADSCPESSDMGVVLAARGPVQWAADSSSQLIDSEFEWGPNQGLGQAVPADARLFARTDLLGGMLSLPSTYAEFLNDDESVIMVSPSGTRELAAEIRAHGNDPQGLLVARFDIWMEVNTYAEVVQFLPYVAWDALDLPYFPPFGP